MINDGYVNGSNRSRTVRRTPFTLRERFIWRRLRWHLSALACAILFLGYLGPFGTYLGMPLGERMAYWVIAVTGNWLIALICILPAVALFAHRIPAVACVLSGSLAASIPGTLLISALGYLFFGTAPETLGSGELFLAVALIHLVIGLVVWGMIELPLRHADGTPFTEAPAVAASDRPTPDADDTVPLLDRLPTGRRGQLRHLQMRDHYVEIHTDRGTDLVLMRFGDALRELGTVEGMQVHRSHWIARAAVKRIVRRAGRTVIFLDNGAEVPVSRRYVPALREANWI